MNTYKDNLIPIIKTPMITKSHTHRGFALGTFDDYYGHKCSIQKSSIATIQCIWLGLEDANPQIMASKIMDNGVGWVKYPIHEDVSLSTRMHLSQEQVKELLPTLQYFAEHGELPE